MKTRIEFLFSHAVVSALKELRGPKWRDLVTKVAPLDATHPDALAFALTMVRLNGCVSCDAKRYRERGGCGHCTRFVLTTLNKESEADLLMRYRTAQKEVAKNFKTQSIGKAA